MNNNSAKKQLKIPGRMFLFTTGAIVNAMSYTLGWDSCLGGKEETEVEQNELQFNHECCFLTVLFLISDNVLLTSCNPLLKFYCFLRTI